MTRPSTSLLKAAGLIALVTVFAKVLGAVRDWQIFNLYGASLATDAYFAAVQIPSFAIILLGGLGGPFHTATVAVFGKLIGGGETADPRVRQLASTFLTLTGVGFALMALLTFLLATPIMAFLLPDAPADLVATAAGHLRIMAPVVFLGGVVGIFYGLLNVYNSFLWPSLSPAALSVVMIAVLLLNPGDPSGQVLAWATLLGALLEVLLQLPVFFRRGFRLIPRLDCQKLEIRPEMRQIGEILFPMVVGTTIGQLMVTVDMLFAARLETGGWSAIVLSNRLLQLPIGVLQTALLLPLFPRLNRYVAESNWGGLAGDFHKGIVSLWLISIPMLVGMLMFAEPLIRLVFEHGRFDAGDTRLVTLALVFQAFQMIPYFARDTLTRVFYAFNDSVTPLAVGVVAIGLKYLLNSLLVAQYGLGGITLATTLITLINMGLLFLLLKRHLPGTGFSGLVQPFLKLVLAGAAMAAVLLALQTWGGAVFPFLGFLSADDLSRPLELAKILFLALAGLPVYLVLVLRVFRVAEARYLLDRLLRRYPTAG